MSTAEPRGAGATGADAGYPASEEELRAAYEAELKRVRVESLVLEQVVTLINMGMRRTGLAPGTEDERDPAQVGTAIDSIRALMPIVEPIAGPQAGALRDALSQLQLAYVKIGGPSAPAPPAAGRPTSSAVGGQAQGAGAGGSSAPLDDPEAGPGPSKPGEPGPAQRSGRLWVPGQ